MPTTLSQRNRHNSTFINPLKYILNEVGIVWAVEIFLAPIEP